MDKLDNKIIATPSSSEGINRYSFSSFNTFNYLLNLGMTYDNKDTTIRAKKKVKNRQARV